ncbi:hypothetical protein [Scytonema tolypothrichoides]|uniref:hypothetical protein n=1 Tax=Scytonema tolypothrichoides TaxID=1233230 RepID=UPI0010FAA081
MNNCPLRFESQRQIIWNKLKESTVVAQARAYRMRYSTHPISSAYRLMRWNCQYGWTNDSI